VNATSRTTARHGDAGPECGGIVGGWLLQMVVILGLIGLVLFEVLSVVVATVSLDDVAREVARATRDEYRVNRSIDAATATAETIASSRDARVTDVVTDDDDLVIGLERDSPTLLVHRIGPLQDLATPSTSARITWTS
jgi:hypothetical protein